MATNKTTTQTKTTKLLAAVRAYLEVEKQIKQLRSMEQEAIANIVAANDGSKSFEGADGQFYTVREYTIKDESAPDHGEKRAVLVKMKAAPQALRASAKKSKERELAIAGLRIVAGGDEKRFNKLLAEFEANEAKAAEAAETTVEETPVSKGKATVTHGKSSLSDDIEA